jgi:Ser/Thr protein kinase RdoA (MazF antagonist)
MPTKLASLSTQEETAANALLKAFDLDSSAVQLLHHGEGIVITSIRYNTPVILKILHSTSDSTAEIQARLDWMNYLHHNGVNVPELIMSGQGQWIEQVKIGDYYGMAYAYTSLPITPECQIDWHDPAMPIKLGEMMGRMHHLARTYHPQPSRPVLPQWQEGDWLKAPEQRLHPSQAAIVAAILRLRQTISQFPQNPNNYGVIHDDLHTGNVFNVNGNLVVIDFDCCHTSWFAADLASALLFRTWIRPEKERQEVKDQAVHFLRGAIEGYQTQSDLPPEWKPMLPYFLKLREISLFQSFYREVDASHYDDELFWYLFNSIRLDKPFLDIELEKLT